MSDKVVKELQDEIDEVRKKLKKLKKLFSIWEKEMNSCIDPFDDYITSYHAGKYDALDSCINDLEKALK